MAVKIDHTLEKKGVQTRKENSPDSTGLDTEEVSRSPKDVLALGQMMVRQLDLNERGQVLERWLAHHLAEVMNEADEAVGSAKADAEARAVDLVLKLWTHRRALPASIDPLDGYGKAIKVLGLLMPDANPWRQFSRSDTCEDLLYDMFGILSRIVVSGLLLTQISHVRPVTTSEFKELEEEEKRLHSMLEEWKSVLHPHPRSKIGIEFIDPGAVSTDDLDEIPENPADTNDKARDPSVQDAGDEDHLRSIITADLERMQAALVTLLDRWQKTTSSDPNWSSKR